jgi:hypothetical protein
MGITPFLVNVYANMMPINIANVRPSGKTAVDRAFAVPSEQIFQCVIM